jgi:two-component system sensor histidine kinase AlgZ
MNMESSDSNAEVTHISRSVFPPTFCDWRLGVAIAAVTQISVLLIGLGRSDGISWGWLSLITAYAQGLALVCTVAVCIGRPWIRQLSIRDAWLACWLIAVVTTFVVSYACAIISTVLGYGPGEEGLPAFMLQSMLAVGLVFMALLRYLFIRSQWQAELVSQADARVQALQARIRPHFLFNSLNTIASLISDEPEKAERVTEDLAELFRGSMRRSDTLIPLSEELDLGRRFLDMEQVRLGNRLRVDWDIEELPVDTMVLPLLLQPLLENAVIHGIQPSEEGGEIRVYGRSEADNIVITIVNPVQSVAARSVMKTAGHGMALRNIRNRLKLVFEGRASLITSQNEDQFFAVLNLPDDSNPDN